jgi:hypothetical protein
MIGGLCWDCYRTKDTECKLIWDTVWESAISSTCTHMVTKKPGAVISAYYSAE